MQANPAPSHERMVVVDVLRAVALFGIIITHAVDGFLAGPPPGPEFMLFSPLDRAVAQLANLLAFGKFYTIFSFLFGLSFAIQISNASRRGVGFSGRFAWRLGVLGLIALAHSAIFTGDILIIYAILGLLLIPFRKLKTRTLLIVATVLVLNVPGILLGVAMLSAAPTPEQVQANAEMQAQFMQAGLRQYEIKQSGTILELAQVSLSTGLLSKMAFMIFSGRLWITFGLFLLGICAGRMEIFRDTEANRQFFRRLFWPSAVVALITTVVAIIKPASMQVASLGNLLASFSFAVQNLALSVFYLAGVTLLFWRQPTRGWLPALAPVGKMGLTTYLGQSVLALLFFYGVGLGMIGRMGAAAAVGVGIAFFILQILFAHFWLRHFSLGPAEWLWRSLTYFKLHPNSRGAASATQAP